MAQFGIDLKLTIYRPDGQSITAEETDQLYREFVRFIQSKVLRCDGEVHLVDIQPSGKYYTANRGKTYAIETPAEFTALCKALKQYLKPYKEIDIDTVFPPADNDQQE